MKNLFKNVVRSFSNNKISLIGLSFLVFFGVGSFSVLSNTTTNITNEYNSISQDGAMHDMTISELYEIGTAGYQTNNAGIIYEGSSEAGTYTPCASFWNVSEQSQQIPTTALTTVNRSEISGSGTYYFPIPTQIKSSEGNRYTRTYHITLDEGLSTGLYSSYAKTGEESIKSVDLTISKLYDVVPAPVTNLQTAWNEPDITKWEKATLDTVTNSNIFALDFQEFTNLLNDQTSIIYDAMTSSDTPMSQELKKNYSDDLDFRFFKSMNITATDEAIYYKVIQSDPTDKIDKIVLFDDGTGKTGNNLFDQNDCAPYNSQLVFYDSLGNVYDPGDKVGPIYVPSTFTDVATQTIFSYEELATPTWTDEAKFLYSQIMQIRFKRMRAGNNTSEDYYGSFNVLAGKEKTRMQYYNEFFSNTELHNAYYYYYSGDYPTESLTISANGNIVFTWTNSLGIIQTCTITNWTNKFSVVNPQHLKATNKKVIDASAFNKFEPFIKWYEGTYHKSFDGIIRQNEMIDWFNSLTFNQFTFWIKPDTDDDWTTMSYDNIPGQTNPVVVTRGMDEGQWNGINTNFIAECGGFYEIIWGCGLSPDFMYPVVDISRPTPNVVTECLVYCNTIGYKTLKLAYVNAPTEEYLVCKFKQNTNTSRQDILNRINDFAKENMIYPEGVKAAYFATDTSNVLNASSFRIAYIPRLVSVIRIVTILIGSFIGILSILICAIIIKRYVENNRINIGIMRANGISKGRIVLSLLPFAFIPSLIGGIGAYLIGFFMQAPALLLFSNYWMLPTPLLGFNVWTLVGCVFLPFILFTAICSISTLIVLRTKAVDLMKSGSEFKTNSFSRIVKKPFKHFGILTRFRVSLAFNSLTRLFMLSIMSTLTMSSLVFAMTSYDRLAQSQKTNSSQFDYAFNIELTTPTASGGVYSTFDFAQDCLGLSNPEQYIYNTNWPIDGVPKQLTKPYAYNQILDIEGSDVGFDYTGAVGERGNLMLPNASDATGQLEDLTYLQHKFSSRLTLDYNIGLGPLSSNPWEIALALMPANSRNMAADAFNVIINKVGKKIYDANEDFINYLLTEHSAVFNRSEWYPNCIYTTTDYETAHTHVEEAIDTLDNKWFRPYYFDDGFGTTHYWRNINVGFFNKNEQDDSYSLKSDMSTVGWLFQAFNEDFIKLLTTIFGDLELMQDEYSILYGLIPLNYDLTTTKKDETYTYVTATLDEISTHKDYDKTHELKIQGIKNDSIYIKLTNKKGQPINDLLFVEPHDDKLPIIVNAYAAHKYGFKIGSTLTVTATNDVNRFDRKENDDRQATYEVVEISQGTNDEAFYISQKNANDILGLPNGSSWNKTHRYALWTGDGETLPTWDSEFVSLADLASDDETNINVWSFNENSSSPISSTVAKFNPAVPVGFNGIFTENKQGKPITGLISLYSYTGMYPGASVYVTETNNKFAQMLAYRNNLALANLMSGIKQDKFYEGCHLYLNNQIDRDTYIHSYVEPFLDLLKNKFGETTMVTAICGAMDVAASDLVYKNLIATFNLAEISIMCIIIPITIIIVGIISNLIVSDSKKMAAMLKALGYGDKKNTMSILALFVPTIIFGLLLAIPLSLGLVLGYQSIIFNTANILVDVSQKWWYYVVATCGIGAILVGTYAVGFVSLKKDRLVDQIK